MMSLFLQRAETSPAMPFSLASALIAGCCGQTRTMQNDLSDEAYTIGVSTYLRHVVRRVIATDRRDGISDVSRLDLGRISATSRLASRP